MNPLPEPKTVDVIALMTRTYGIQEDHALKIMQRVLRQRAIDCKKREESYAAG